MSCCCCAPSSSCASFQTARTRLPPPIATLLPLPTQFLGIVFFGSFFYLYTASEFIFDVLLSHAPHLRCGCASGLSSRSHPGHLGRSASPVLKKNSMACSSNRVKPRRRGKQHKFKPHSTKTTKHTTMKTKLIGDVRTKSSSGGLSVKDIYSCAFFYLYAVG